jgi:predicted branched-subunit amino acid permease
MLYGMFIAIVVPPAQKEKEILAAVILALVLSSCFGWIPLLKQVSAGIAIVICTVVAAAVCAALFPIKEEEEAA